MPLALHLLYRGLSSTLVLQVSGLGTPEVDSGIQAGPSQVVRNSALGLGGLVGAEADLGRGL